jgi:hypothetical protein
MSISETLYAVASDLAAVKRNDEGARRRLVSFRTRLDDRYQCPGCWMRNEVASPLDAVPGTEREDKMRCRGCGAEYVIPLGG